MLHGLEPFFGCYFLAVRFFNCLGSTASTPQMASVNDGGIDSVWSLVGATPAGRTYYSRILAHRFGVSMVDNPIRLNVPCVNCGRVYW